MAKRGSDWRSFLRALAILKRLMEGPATREQLFEAVRSAVGADAYPDSVSAREHAFKHDRRNVRERLQADFSFDAVNYLYVLNDAGPFGQLSFSPSMIRALSFLSRQADNPVWELAGVRDLIHMLVGWLSPEARRQLEQDGETWTVDLGLDVDRSTIPPRVWQEVNRAVGQHRKLTFHYLFPRRADRQPLAHEVAPYDLRLQNGHWYLRGYRLKAGEGDDRRLSRFRLSYILDDERLCVLPSRVETRHRQPPRFLVHYWLAPEIGRGEISHRFANMEITRHPDGSAEVRAFTDDVWEAVRILLTYGEKCVVLGGEEVRREMQRVVREMAERYGYL